MMMHNLSVAALIKGLKNKDFSSVELTQHYLNRINKSKLNAFISVTENLALAQANEADLKIGRLVPGLLRQAHNTLILLQALSKSGIL